MIAWRSRRVDALTVFMFVGAVLCLARAFVGCSGAQIAAESAYGAEQLRCVDKATTLAESRACRAESDRRWGITTTERDGGR